MLIRPICLLALALLLATPAAAAPPKPAKPADTKDSPKGSPNDLGARLQGLLEANFLTVNCEIPVITPHVAPLKRGNTAPSKADLMQRFFGGEQGISSSEQMRSPIYGKGTRYKTAHVVYLSEIDANNRINPNALKKHESVVAFLDLYPTGFTYQNNMPHTPVRAADIPTSAKNSKDIRYFNVYSETEGKRAVEDLLQQEFGGLKVPSGFQTSVRTVTQDFGEKLFVYRVQPEYMANVEVTNPNGTKQTIKSGIPILDSFVSVQLDGEKLLAGMEYFWDSGLTPAGPPKAGMVPHRALFEFGRAGLLKFYNRNPPLMTVSQFRLGYIIDRKQSSQLVPVYVFDAMYSQPDPKQDNSTGTWQHNMVNLARPFAVNVLTGEFIPLWQ